MRKKIIIYGRFTENVISSISFNSVLDSLESEFDIHFLENKRKTILPFYLWNDSFTVSQNITMDTLDTLSENYEFVIFYITDPLVNSLEYPVLAIIQANQFIKKFDEIEKDLYAKLQIRTQLSHTKLEELFEIELGEIIKRIKE